MNPERQFFGGEDLEKYGKKLEAENKAEETVEWGELMNDVGEQMNKVVDSLERERALAAEIRGMGGKVTRETAQKINDLEKQKNDLLKVYEETLEPASKEAAMAFINKEGYFVAKPEDLEAMMTDPDEIEVTDDMVIESQTSEEIAKLEKDLRDEADKANEEMVSLIEQMNKAKNSPEPLIPTGLSEDLKKQHLGILETRFNELYNYVKAINGKLAEVRMNLALVKRLESGEEKKAA